jgi:hypothetical protein
MYSSAFKQLYDISNNKYYTAYEDVENAEAFSIHSNFNNQHAIKVTACKHMNHWITTFVKDAGEQNPTNYWMVRLVLHQIIINKMVCLCNFSL